MATPTYELIETTTLSSSASSVTFSSITQDYRDLVLVVEMIGNETNPTQVWLRFNSDSGANYNAVDMEGDGAFANSGSSSNATQISTNLTANDAFSALGVFQFLDYSATDKHKSILARNSRHTSSSDFRVYAEAYRWANTSAITNIEAFYTFRDFGAGSSFSLYGIAS